MSVSVLLISHNGERWLPGVIEGLTAQTITPDRVAAVDTGSKDESARLLRGQPTWIVSRLDADVSFGAAVRHGLHELDQAPALPKPAPTAAAPRRSKHSRHSAVESAEPAGPAVDWVWILHDDSNPAPDALELLLIAAESNPDFAIFGPKLREWPSLQRLLELGVTISGTGRRETGLERGEYDQGQHDEARAVLAVNTAGMLIRRDLLDRLGFDDDLPVFGNDIDLGWRAARAGEQAMVVPEAVVFHAEAATRGAREMTGSKHHRKGERAAAVFTLLANSPGVTVPAKAIRLLLGSVLRTLGLLLMRAPREAFDDLAGTVSVLARPGRLIAARRRRREQATVAYQQVKPLLAPPWLPYRHGLDFVGDVAQAAIDTGRERIGGRDIRSASLLTGDQDALSTSQEPGLFGLLLRAPTTWLVLGSLLLAGIASRDLFTGGTLHGGALLPSPDSVGHWWSTYFSAHHNLGTGSGAPAPAYLLPFAVLGTLLLGNPSWLIAIVFIAGAPLSAMAALRFLRRILPDVSANSPAPFWGATGYALLPVLTGALSQGRLGTVAGALILPVVACSALGLQRRDDDLRWRAVWRTTLGLGLLVALVPAAWLLALILCLLWAGHGRGSQRGNWQRRNWWSMPVVIVLGSALLNLPWVVGVVTQPGAWLVEAGAFRRVNADPSWLEGLFGASGGPGQAPLWILACLIATGLFALGRGSVRGPVLLAWTVALSAAALAAAVLSIDPGLPGVTMPVRGWAGFLLLVAQAAVLTAAVLAGHRSLSLVRGSGPVLLRGVAGVGLVVALLGVVAGAGWWALVGTAGPLHRGHVPQPPGYMSEVTQARDNGVLVLRGNVNDGVTYQVLRDGPLRVGDDGIVALTAPDDELGTVVQEMLSDPDSDATSKLADFGIGYIFERGPVSSSISGTLDASSDLSRASALAGDAAWRVQTPGDDAALDDSSQPLRGLLIVLQLLAIVAAISLALPSRKGRE